MGCGPSAASGAPPPVAVEHRQPATTAAAARRGDAAGPVTLDNGVPDEVLLHVCSFLGVRELSRLECASSRFGARESPTSALGNRWYPPRPGWSVTQEAARRRVVAAPSERRSGRRKPRIGDPDVLSSVAHALLCGGGKSPRCLCRPRWQHPVGPAQSRGSWLRLLHEVDLARAPLRFDRADGSVELSEGGRLATKSSTGSSCVSSHKVMRAGRFFVEFTVVAPDNAIAGGFFGLVRPLSVQREAYRGQLRRSEAQAAGALAAARAAEKLADDEAVAKAAAAAVATAEAKLAEAAAAVRAAQPYTADTERAAAGAGGGSTLSAAEHQHHLNLLSGGDSEIVDVNVGLLRDEVPVPWATSLHAAGSYGGTYAMRMAEGLVVGDPLYYRYKGDPDPGHYYRHEGDRIGLCLDLQPPFAGDLSVYKNGTYLGLVATSLSGEYCWAAEMHDKGASVRIEPKPTAPPRPHPRPAGWPAAAAAGATGEELALVSVQQQQTAGSSGGGSISPLKAQIEAMVAAPEEMLASRRATDLVTASSLTEYALAAKESREAALAAVATQHHLSFEAQYEEYEMVDGTEGSTSDDGCSDGDLESMQGEDAERVESSLVQIDRLETENSVSTWRARNEVHQQQVATKEAQRREEIHRKRAEAEMAVEERTERWAQQREDLAQAYRRRRDIELRYFPASCWDGVHPGWVFKTAELGLGYYPDDTSLLLL